MSVARSLLEDLAVIGATVEPAGERLILRAGPIAIPAALVRRVRDAKTDLIAQLAIPVQPLPHGRDQEPAARLSVLPNLDVALGKGVIDWLNQHPAPSSPGRCAWCGKTESAGAVVLPFGTEPGTHTWLHAECWPAWSLTRRDQAMRQLTYPSR